MQKQLLKISVPADLDFADLDLRRLPDGQVEFNWAPIERLCAINGLDIAQFRDAHEDNVSGLLVAWYLEHLAHGGARDPVQDDLICEVLIEDESGGGISYPPGIA